MDALPPNQGGASGSGSGGPPPGKGNQQGGGARQQVVDLFGVDMGTAAFTLVLLMLGLLRASMTRCECL